MTAEVWDWSATMKETLQYVSYLYLYDGNNILANNDFYTELKNWEKFVMYNLQIPRLSMVLESPGASVAVALGFT